VLVSTAGGAIDHVNTLGERIFSYGPAGNIENTITVDEGPASNMGLGGMAFDASNRLYVADMNGLVRRFDDAGSSDTVASAPLPYSTGSWATSMWNDIDFDEAGNAYITDGGFPAGGRIWRLTPDGTLSIWFSDPHLFFGGPFQAQVDASGRYLYFVVLGSGSPDTMFAGIVYRLPLVDHPQTSDLQEIHRFNVDQSDLTTCVPSHLPLCGPLPNGWVCQLGLAPPCSFDLAPPAGCSGVTASRDGL
jgi:hypothetical protein